MVLNWEMLGLLKELVVWGRKKQRIYRSEQTRVWFYSNSQKTYPLHDPIRTKVFSNKYSTTDFFFGSAILTEIQLILNESET